MKKQDPALKDRNTSQKKLEYKKPEIKKQGDLKKITALSFQPPQ